MNRLILFEKIYCNGFPQEQRTKNGTLITIQYAQFTVLVYEANKRCQRLAIHKKISKALVMV